MSEPSSINAKIQIPNQGKSGKLQRILTLDIISEWIKIQGFDEYTTNGLIELASKYPAQALPSFKRNFNLMIERVRAQRKRELNGLENSEENDNA